MPNALNTPGFPNTQVIGSEQQGRGIPAVGQDNAGNICTPNGTIGTPAAIQTLIQQALAAGRNTTGLSRTTK